MTDLKLTGRKAKLVEAVIRQWIADKTVTQEEGERLLRSYEIVSFDWKRLAKYSFWISLICIITAVGAILADEALMALLARIFRAPDIIKCLFFAAIAAALYYAGQRRRRKKPGKIFSNEAIFALGVFATATAIAFFGKAIDTGSGHFSLLVLLAAIIYAILSLWFPSKLIWIFALLSLGGWFGAETGYKSGWGAYYLGMNYPLRFVIFGVVLTAAASLFAAKKSLRDFVKSTRVMGLLYLFVALWILSIFGNHGEFESWYKVKQIELFHWSLFFGIAALAAILHGIKFDDPVTRGFGLTFLFINLYTRYCEFFWDALHKAIFFAILAVSFWFLGRKAEKIWNLGRLKGQSQIEDDEEG